MKKQILDLRPYSWVDLVLLGYLAKFSVARELIFSPDDSFFVVCLLFLWFFFNLALEKKHSYNYRGKIKIIFPVIFLIFVTIISIYKNAMSLIPLVISCMLVLFYLQKNKNKLLGILSSVIRGLIETTYFVFVLVLLGSSINETRALLCICIFLIYTVRAIIGDIRDKKHNKEAKKQTIPVLFGAENSKYIVIAMLLIVSLIIIFYFNSVLVAIPLILFGILLLYYSNGYVLHQLMILTTSFFCANCITILTNQNLFFLNLIYLGIFLNQVFYPLLERKSNPKFIN